MQKLIKSKDMTSYVLTINEENSLAKSLLKVLKSLSYVTIMPQKKAKKITAFDEAMDDVKNGRVTKYENYEEYEKAMYKMLGYV